MDAVVIGWDDPGDFPPAELLPMLTIWTRVAFHLNGIFALKSASTKTRSPAFGKTGPFTTLKKFKQSKINSILTELGTRTKGLAYFIWKKTSSSIKPKLSMTFVTVPVNTRCLACC